MAARPIDRMAVNAAVLRLMDPTHETWAADAQLIVDSIVQLPDARGYREEMYSFGSQGLSIDRPFPHASIGHFVLAKDRGMIEIRPANLSGVRIDSRETRAIFYDKNNQAHTVAIVHYEHTAVPMRQCLADWIMDLLCNVNVFVRMLLFSLISFRWIGIRQWQKTEFILWRAKDATILASRNFAVGERLPLATIQPYDS